MNLRLLNGENAERTFPIEIICTLSSGFPLLSRTKCGGGGSQSNLGLNWRETFEFKDYFPAFLITKGYLFKAGFCTKAS
jgi:hypothetical protein